MEAQLIRGEVARVGAEWLPTHRSGLVRVQMPAHWVASLDRRIANMFAVEEERNTYSRTSVQVDMGHPATVYKNKGPDFFVLGYHADGKDGRVELSATHAYLLLGEKAYEQPLNPEQLQQVAEISEHTRMVPPVFDILGAYSKNRGEFIRRLQGGFVLRNGDWLPTHKITNQFETMALNPTMAAVLNAVLATEHSNPTQNGGGGDLATDQGPVRWSKWLDTRVVPRDGILDIRVANSPRVELTIQHGYILENYAPKRFDMPPDMSAKLQGIFARSPNPYAQSKTSFEPATGVIEQRLRGKARIIVGIDESGRGNWAGPLTAAAVAYDGETPHPIFKELRDSKSYNAVELRQAYGRLVAAHVPLGIGIVTAAEINRGMNLDVANRLAFTRALDNLIEANPSLAIDCVLIDGANITLTDPKFRVEQVPQGERHSMAIAAASVAATFTQHSALCDLGKQFPGLGFEDHHGAGNKDHEARIRRNGLTPAHRTTFAPIKRLQLELGPSVDV